jgi:hypothetical protein
MSLMQEQDSEKQVFAKYSFQENVLRRMVRPRPRGQAWQVEFSLEMGASPRLPARTRAHHLRNSFS